ncbi:MAG: amidohydrolase family protein [Planctomycetes bacterium]|nr:amidohydrolase family protein [Planctomycetota bacterium]
MRIRAVHYATGTPIDLLVEGGNIQAVENPNLSRPDLESGWVAPALFDLQINGCDGFSFNSPNLTREHIHHIAGLCRRHGIGAFCPTLITNSADALRHAFATLAQACAESPELARALPAFHLEGPYISPEDGPRGAHPLRHVRPPDWDEFRRFQDTASGRIRLVTLAPEIDGALPFIERLTASGVVVALGHTSAKPATIRDAIRAGARLSTHLGNGSHALLPRHENYFLEQMAADQLWASIICDGHHLPPGLVQIIARAKGPERLILTCDAGSLAGLPPGRYRDWDQEFEVVSEGKIVVPGTGFLAGSWVFTDVCIGNMLNFTKAPLSQAIDMATVQPRRILGLPTPELTAGQPADLILFDWEPGGAFSVRSTMIAGAVG